MTQNIHKVQEFFDATSNYLHVSYGIKVRSEIVADLIGAPTDTKILDVGCGNGVISRQFVRSNRVTFLDLASNMIDLARRGVDPEYRSNARFLVGSFLDVDLNETFDYLFAIGLLAHVPSAEEAIKRIHSLVTEKGCAIIQFSNFSNWLTKWQIMTSSSYGYEVNKLSYKAMKRMVEASGFRILKEVQFSLTLPGMGRLPDAFLYRYSRFVLKNRLTSRLGTDFIWLLGKGVSR